MPVPVDLRLSLLELTHLLDRLLRHHRSRPLPPSGHPDDQELDRFCAVADLTLLQARAVLDFSDADFSNTDFSDTTEAMPDLHAPVYTPPWMLGHQIHARRARTTQCPSAHPPSSRPRP